MAAVAGLRGTGDWGADERPKNFREMILWRNPKGKTPITGLMARANKSAVSDPEFSWWDEPVDLVRLQVNGALVAGDTTVVVDSSDPSASTPGNRWGTAQHLVIGDVLQVEKTSETTTYDNELIVVTGVDSATQFTAERGAAGTTAAAIGNDAFLLKIGNVYSEGSASPKVTSRNPIKYTNYCQIFKTAYELTGTTLVTSTRTGDPLKNEKKRRMSDHAVAIEHALLWGVNNETTGTNGKPLRYTAGIRAQIPASNATIFAGSPDTVLTFLDAVYPVFDFDTEAGDERIAICGNSFLNELNKIVMNNSNTQIQYGGKIETFGMALREYILPQGTLLLKTHPLLNRNTMYTGSAFLMDFSQLRWRHTKGRDTHFQDNIQNNDEDTKKGQWFTEGGLEMWGGGLSFMYLGSLSST